jgi:hypothetical protein
LPDLVLESQGAFGRQQRIGFHSDNPVSEVQIIGSVVTIVQANIEDQILFHAIRYFSSVGAGPRPAAASQAASAR